MGHGREWNNGESRCKTRFWNQPPQIFNETIPKNFTFSSRYPRFVCTHIKLNTLFLTSLKYLFFLSPLSIYNHHHTTASHHRIHDTTTTTQNPTTIYTKTQNVMQSTHLNHHCLACIYWHKLNWVTKFNISSTFWNKNVLPNPMPRTITWPGALFLVVLHLANSTTKNNIHQQQVP